MKHHLLSWTRSRKGAFHFVTFVLSILFLAACTVIQSPEGAPVGSQSAGASDDVGGIVASYLQASMMYGDDLVVSAALVDGPSGPTVPNCAVPDAPGMGQGDAYAMGSGDAYAMGSGDAYAMGSEIENHVGNVQRAEALSLSEDLSNLVDTTDVDGTALLIVDDFSSEEAHGPGVLWHTLELLDHRMGSAGARDFNQTYTFSNGFALVPVSIDLNGSFTVEVANAMQAALTNLQNQNYNRQALNMSFVVVPCSVLQLLNDHKDLENGEDLAQTLSESDTVQTLASHLSDFSATMSEQEIEVWLEITFEGHQAIIEAMYQIVFDERGSIDSEGVQAVEVFIQDEALATEPPLKDSVLDALFTPVHLDGDPLLELIRSLNASSGLIGNDSGSWYAKPITPDQEAVTFVASAGNLGWLKPFFPAAMPEVIAVSSHDLGHDVRSSEQYGEDFRWSNSAQVMAPGAYFVLEDMGYHGTTYASPHVGVYASYALQTRPDCVQDLLLSPKRSNALLTTFICH